VVGGNYVIGVIVFAILVVVNFVVITKGSGRIAEVAARFTLDAMPGKQMAIDADLNAGLITEQQARSRRSQVASEAEFYGAMDGASKFVRGDAIAGIIITLINIVGGFIIGMMQMHLAAGEALHRFTLLTVGDGLVSQIPALLISTAAGMIVTRQSSDLNLGQALTMQIFRQPKAVYLASGTLLVMALVPGLPTLPFLLLSGVFGIGGRLMVNKVKEADRVREQDEATAESSEAPSEAPSEVRASELFVTDTLELELGYGLLPLVDGSKGGDLLARITRIRKQISQELGFLIHPIRVRDNLQLGAREYAILLKGVSVARAELRPDRLLAMSTTMGDSSRLEGVSTVEPAFQLPAVWITPERRAAAEMEGFTVVEPTAVLATHLSEIIRANADELLSRQDVKDACETVREFAPSLVEDLIPDKVSINTLHNVLRGLLHERVPIKDIVTILETLANNSGTAGTDQLLERVREALRRVLSSLYLEPDGKLHVIALHPETEQFLTAAARTSDQTGAVALDPFFAQELLARMERTLQQVYGRGRPPVLLVPTPIRLFVKRLLEPTFPLLPVLGYTEITPGTAIQSEATVHVPGERHEREAAV